MPWRTLQGQGTPLGRGPLKDRLGSSQTSHLEHMTSPRRPLCLLPAHPEGQTLAGGGQEDLSPSWHPVWVPHPSTGLRGHLDLGALFGSGEDTGAPRTGAQESRFRRSD